MDKLLLIFLFFLSTSNTASIEQLEECQDFFAVDSKPIEIVAHRGANHLAPENTFASAQKCIDLGIEYVEIDVRKSRDGIYYIFHDPILNRTTNGFGVFGWTSSKKINQLEAGSHFGEAYQGEKIPELTEFLRWANGKIKVYLDVKSGEIEDIIQIVKETKMDNQVFFWFSSNRKAKKFHSLAPTIPLKINAKDSEQVLQLKNLFDVKIIECRLSDFTPSLLQTCKENGIRLMIYAKENTGEEYQKILESGVDMVNLDRPALFAEMRSKFLLK